MNINPSPSLNKVFWKEAAATGVSGTVFTVSTVAFFVLLGSHSHLNLVSYSLMGTSGASYIILLVSAYQLRKKTGELFEARIRAIAFETPKADLLPKAQKPEQPIEVKEEEEPEEKPSDVVENPQEPNVQAPDPIQVHQPEEPPQRPIKQNKVLDVKNDLLPKDIVLLICSYLGPVEIACFARINKKTWKIIDDAGINPTKRMNKLKSEMGISIICTKDFFCELIKAFYRSKDRTTFSPPINKDVTTISNSFATIQKTVDLIINEPSNFFRMALNLLPRCIDESKFEVAFTQKDNQVFLEKFLKSFEFSAELKACGLHLIFSEFVEGVPKNIDPKTADLIKNLRVLKHEYDESNAKNMDWPDIQKRAIAMNQGVTLLLDHLFVISNHKKITIARWMYTLIFPLFDLLKINEEAINLRIGQIQNGFLEGMFTSQFLTAQIEGAVGDKLANIVKKGLTTMLGLKAIKVFANGEIKKNFDFVTAPFAKRHLQDAIINLLDVLLEPLLTGFFVDEDPLRIRIEEIVLKTQPVKASKEKSGLTLVSDLFGSLISEMINSQFKK